MSQESNRYVANLTNTCYLFHGFFIIINIYFQKLCTYCIIKPKCTLQVCCCKLMQPNSPSHRWFRTVRKKYVCFTSNMEEEYVKPFSLIMPLLFLREILNSNDTIMYLLVWHPKIRKKYAWEFQLTKIYLVNFTFEHYKKISMKSLELLFCKLCSCIIQYFLTSRASPFPRR